MIRNLAHTPAQTLHTKHGFSVSRELHCYERPAAPFPGHACPEPNRDATDFSDTIPIDIFCSFRPTWQNALESYRNIHSAFAVVSEFDNGRPIGYGIVHRNNGGILQLGIDPKERSIDVLLRLVAKMSACTLAPVLRYLNVEAGCAIEPLLLKAEFTCSVKQFEMIYIAESMPSAGRSKEHEKQSR